MELMEKIKSREALVGVIGLGYVGLPLVIRFCETGFNVIGFDVDGEKIAALKRGDSYIRHIGPSLISRCAPRFRPESDFSKLSEADCVIICVPTPLNRHREPDLSAVTGAAEALSGRLRRGQLVVLESTTYPGTTDEEVRPALEKSGLKAGVDFYLAYSPEREDPNNASFNTGNTPKIVGGYTEDCLKAAVALYGQIVERTVPVSSTRVAESAKLLENIYRAVNIALVNELKMLFDRMGIDICEVIEAARTKPFGFQAFYPGPGLGGHCIPIDPFYLTWKAREYDFHTKFIELAGEINTVMPYYVVQKIVEALNRKCKTLNGSSVLVLGLAYKGGVDDCRESPSIRVMEILMDKGARVDYNDPYIPEAPKLRRQAGGMRSVPLTPEALGKYDCVLIVTNHPVYDPEFIVENSSLVIDTRNLVRNNHHPEKVVKA